MTTPKVSVIIPTHNRTRYVAEALDSVLAQTYTDYEIIVIDDGSTDNTREVLVPYMPYIRYIWQENRERSAARNAGLEAARGKYVSFLDDDDFFLPNKLAVQIAMLDTHTDLGLVAGGHQYVDERRSVIGEGRPWEKHKDLGVETWLCHCPFLVHAACTRREWLEQVGGFDTNLRCREDWDCWLRLASAGCQMGWVEEIVCGYRLHNASTSTNVLPMRAGLLAMLDKFFAQSGLHSYLLPFKSRIYANAYLLSSGDAYASGLIEDAKADVQRAMDICPAALTSDMNRTVNVMLGAAKAPHHGKDLVAIATLMVENLPESDRNFSQFKRQLIAQAAMSESFQAFTRRDWQTVRRALPVAIRNDPRWLANRGVLSIWCQSLLGRRHAPGGRG